MNHENQKTYTYEELCSLPANQLLDLFIENGLVVNERLKETFTDEELQELFNDNFHLLHKGLPPIRSDTMYLNLANETKEVYDKISQ